MKRENKERRSYVYVDTDGKIQEVYCTRRDYLFLKMCYGADGLSVEEYKEYKSLSV